VQLAASQEGLSSMELASHCTTSFGLRMAVIRCVKVGLWNCCAFWAVAASVVPFFAPHVLCFYGMPVAFRVHSV
jgi:hypothetical protein